MRVPGTDFSSRQLEREHWNESNAVGTLDRARELNDRQGPKDRALVSLLIGVKREDRSCKRSRRKHQKSTSLPTMAMMMVMMTMTTLSRQTPRLDETSATATMKRSRKRVIARQALRVRENVKR